MAPGPSPISILHLSSRRCGLPPLTAASRNSVPNKVPNRLFLQHSLQERSFSRSLFLRNSDLEGTRHSGDGSRPRVPDTEAHSVHCPCCAQWRAVMTVQGPSASGSPFWDATLATLMGIGFGKPCILNSTHPYIFRFRNFRSGAHLPLDLWPLCTASLRWTSPLFGCTLHADVRNSNDRGQQAYQISGLPLFQSNSCFYPQPTCVSNPPLFKNKEAAEINKTLIESKAFILHNSVTSSH